MGKPSGNREENLAVGGGIGGKMESNGPWGPSFGLKPLYGENKLQNEVPFFSKAKMSAFLNQQNYKFTWLVEEALVGCWDQEVVGIDRQILDDRRSAGLEGDLLLLNLR